MLDAPDNEESFAGRTEELKSLVDLLSCLYVDSVKEQVCLVDVSADSFNFKVAGRGRSCQVRSLYFSLLSIFLIYYRVELVSESAYLRHFNVHLKRYLFKSR